MVFIISLGGILWEANDLIDENRGRSSYSSETAISLRSYDEYGDPYAVSRTPPPPPVRYAKLWSSPISMIGFSFLIAILVGSLFRSLVKGVVSLILLLLFIGFAVGQGGLLQLFDGSFGRDFFNSVGNWIHDKGGAVGQYARSYLPASSAAVVGFVMGLLK